MQIRSNDSYHVAQHLMEVQSTPVSKTRVPQSTPEWTSHTERDPGVATRAEPRSIVALLRDIVRSVLERFFGGCETSEQEQPCTPPGAGAGADAEEVKRPFFDRFLEGQDRGEATQIQTLKFPSDGEDGGSCEEPSGPDGGDLVTLKFPSDAEDGGSDGCEESGGPDGGSEIVTLKFPSDGEDGGSDGGFELPDNAVTLKFPSDHEDGGSCD